MDRQIVPGVIEYGVGSLLLVLSLAAAVSVVTSHVHGAWAKALWSTFVLCIPLAGAVLWIFAGRETPEEREMREPAVQ